MAYDLSNIFSRIVHDLEMTPSVSLAQISRNLGVERHTVEKAIKATTGITFREFRANILLKHAEDLLKDRSNRTVKEVAFALGYRSQGSLSRFIRMATGRPTRSLRRSS